MKYEIKFSDKNNNVINIYKDGNLHNLIACPPIEVGCDVIDFDNEINSGYNFNFKGLVLITTKTTRKIYYKGKLIDKVKRS